MPSQAAIDGIGANGLAWKLQITIPPYPENVDLGDLDNLRRWQVSLNTLFHKISKPKMSEYFDYSLDSFKEFLYELLTPSIEDIEKNGETDIWDDSEHLQKEMNHVLNQVYDDADYYRILINRTTQS